MIEIKIKKLVWDKWNLEHIKKHDVRREEVEEAVLNRIEVKHSYNERFLIAGKIANGRMITVILSLERNDEYYVVSARDTSRSERRTIKIYEKCKKTKNA